MPGCFTGGRCCGRKALSHEAVLTHRMSQRGLLAPAPLPWRLRAGRVLDGHAAHLTILLAIFVDVCAVVGETLLHSLCPKGDPAVHSWVVGLGWTSRAVLIALIVHQAVLAGVFGVGAYLRHPWYVFDVAVLIVSLVLELTLSEDIEGGLLVLLLVWRGVRLVHGFAAEVHEGDEEKEALRRYYESKIAALEAQLAAAHGGEGGRRRRSSVEAQAAAAAAAVAVTVDASGSGPAAPTSPGSSKSEGGVLVSSPAAAAVLMHTRTTAAAGDAAAVGASTM